MDEFKSLLAALRPMRAPRVLVVEDDAGVCSLIDDILEVHGYDVVCTHTDQDAYRLLLDDAASFAAVILDINLGVGTTGFDVARFARRLNPSLPVIYLTAASAASVEKFAVKDSVYIGKPFDTQHLVNALVRQTSPIAHG